jgi:hypothetical protein
VESKYESYGWLTRTAKIDPFEKTNGQIGMFLSVFDGRKKTDRVWLFVSTWSQSYEFGIFTTTTPAL